MYIEKYGSNYEGLPMKKQTFRQIVNRLQSATHFFIDECDAYKYLKLAKMYRFLSEKDKRQFDKIMDSMQAFIDYMAFDGAGTTKVIAVTDEIPKYRIEEL